MKHDLDIDVLLLKSMMQFLGLHGVKGMYSVMCTLCSPIYVIVEILELECSSINNLMLKIHDHVLSS